MEQGLSIQDIAKIIKKRIFLIIVFIMIGTGISIGMTFYILTPIYEAQTQILVNQKSDADEVYSWQTTETDLRLINTYHVIMTSPVILNPVMERLQLGQTIEQLTEQITVSSENDSKVVNINVVDQDALQAVKIANMVASVFQEQIPELMRVDNVSVLSEAKQRASPVPVKPNKAVNIAAGVFVGLFIGMGIAFLLEFLDTTIKTEQDVEQYIGLPIMGVVGFIKDEKKRRFSFMSRKTRGNRVV